MADNKSCPPTIKIHQYVQKDVYYAGRWHFPVLAYLLLAENFLN